MTISLDPLTLADLDVAHALVRDPSLAPEFEMLLAEGALQEKLGDSFADPALRWIARVDGVPAGFAMTFVVPSTPGPFGFLRIGVLERFRRRGIATRMLDAALAGLDARAEVPEERCLNHWVPNAEAAAFAAARGFGHARSFWRMQRPLGKPLAPVWPAGCEVRAFDGSEAELTAWNDAYNAAFAEHYHFVRSDREHTREVTRWKSFNADGLGLAWRNGACVGFCRCGLFGTRGEIGVLGTVPEARGIGLGRALLRWGVAWLHRPELSQLTLDVDGENENALGLYRDEGFEVIRRRDIWSRRRSLER